MPTPKKPTPSNAKASTPNALRRGLLDALKRSPAAVVPPAYRFLFAPSRYKVAYGGRGAGRSWSFARALILKAQQRKTRILCAREIQASISESVHRLLSDQIALLGFGDFFEIQQYSISGKNGSEFFFEGLRSNSSKIKSFEGIDICWIEEAAAITEQSWSDLTPTIRKKGSEIWLTFNPFLASDPTYKRFVMTLPRNAIVKKTTYLDNPFFPQELEDERAYLQSVDDDAYRHVWLGECRTISDALILKNKFFAEPFTVDPAWSGPHHGLDFGFSRDPSAAVQLFIDDTNKVLYVAREYWALGTDIDQLPHALETAIPGISTHTLFCDNSRPESISYLARHGIAGARAADKWGGSVDDGIAYLRSFQKIVVHPDCKHFLDECRNYSFRCDRLTGLPLPEPEDRFNHLIDSARYALSPLIRNLPMSGFFSRSALLIRNQPADPDVYEGAPLRVFGVLGVSERPNTAAALVIFLVSPLHGIPLMVLDYALAEIDEALSIGWLETMFDHMRKLSAAWGTRVPVALHVESDDFGETVALRSVEHGTERGFQGTLMHVFMIEKSADLPRTLDDRTQAIRSTVNAGQLVKVSRTAFEHEITHRNVTANHFLSQVLGYRAGVRDVPQEVVGAFATGVLISREKQL